MTCNGPDTSGATPATDQEWMQEHSRLGTFVEFPLDCPVSATALARAGFVYTGEGDKVKCCSCHTTVEGWTPGDSAFERHKRLSPDCKFITQSASLENNVAQHRTENGSSDSALTGTLDDPSDLEADYLLRTRQVVDMSDSLYPKTPAMCSEETRLRSFHNWPLTSPLTPKELANAGFYYTGVCDQVACFCCGGKLKQWEPSDRAWSEHKRHFPICPFVLGRDVGNIPSESLSADLVRSGLNSTQQPRNPSMAKYGKRLQTFLTWMYPVDKEQLAEAGFYSIGNGDHVVCFHCGGALEEWKENEDPWDQHAKWFPGGNAGESQSAVCVRGQNTITLKELLKPKELQHSLHHLVGKSSAQWLDWLANSESKHIRCSFVRNEKGIEFINNVHLRDGCRDSTTEAAEGTILHEDDLLQNPLVQSAIDMGFSLSEIRNTMEKRLHMSGESHTSVEDLVADLSAQKENAREEEPKAIPVQQDELIHLQNLYLSTEEKLRRLQEEKLCKICMAKDIAVVLIPCGHLVACKDCAGAFNQCPLCRTTIMKRQDIFMY